METNTIVGVKKSFSADEKQIFINRWKQSGQTKLAFAKEHGINYYTLVSWVTPKGKKAKDIKAGKSTGSFTEVVPTEQTPLPFARISSTQHTLEFFKPVSADFLKVLLK